MSVNGCCSDCRFFQSHGDLKLDNMPAGTCRRRAPGVGQYTENHARWPFVSPGDWCGEFRRPEDRAVDELLDLIQMVRGSIGICGHGSIGVTCYLCMGARIAGSMPR